MDAIIRLVEPQEYDALGELTARTYLDDGLLAFGEEDPYLPVLRDTAERAAQSEVLVAVDGSGRLLGGVAFTPGARPYANIAGDDEAEFRMLVVATEARKRGVGEALVMACVERARAIEGCRRLVLSTDQQMHAAHRIYERLGFVRTPGRDWSPFAELEPLLTYALEL
ncbi:GNAT family N-acetyltransferase [Streptomyces sp. NPDC019396]|uniref:GNAT family N-acetyltransferase n=1 Tax=Streptomyces sp. NPDC019396 TaxID=3154687 RepID=UPI0033F4DF95